MKQTTRPPAQYVVAPGTQFRFVANEYDKNKYGQCNYASYRTLVRCKQIRSKEELKKTGGRCEEHIKFAKTLENNHKKEVLRCHAESDSKMQRRRFDPWIVSNEHISDEDDYLQAVSTVPETVPDTANHNVLDEHPLRYAKHYTDKDVLKIKMSLVQQDIDDLMEFKRLVVAQAQKEHDSMGSDDDDAIPNDMAQRRVFKAAQKYARNDYLTLTTIDPVFKQCSMGPDMEDQLIITHLVHSMLQKIDGIPMEPPVEKQCQKPALHLTRFCIDHIFMDRHQQLFGKCMECERTAINGGTPRCSFHLREHEKKNTRCTCAKCVPESSKGRTSRNEINVVDDDDALLGNLSRIESMVSPMQQYSNPPPNYQPTPSSRRYLGPSPASLLRPSQMGPPPTAGPSSSQMHKGPVRPSQPGLTPQQIQEQQALKMQEEEIRSQTCARVRPLDPSTFGAGKKNKVQLQRTTFAPGIAGSPYQQQQQIKKMPSIISPNVYNSPPGGIPKTFQGWKNQAASAGQRPIPHQQPGIMGMGAQPTRYPIHINRNQPKTIPLERVQEPRTGDELVEDRSHSPSRYMPEPQRRGVPYYKNAAYRRTETPARAPLPHQYPPQHQPPLQPSTSTSSSQLLGPPVSPHTSPKMYRPAQSRLPMAPHRAIAAGLNPADVGPPPRAPGFRMGTPGLRPHPHVQQSAYVQQPVGPPPPGSRPRNPAYPPLGPRPRPPQQQHVVRSVGPAIQRVPSGTITTSYVVQGPPSEQQQQPSGAPGPVPATLGAPGAVPGTPGTSSESVGPPSSESPSTTTASIVGPAIVRSPGTGLPLAGPSSGIPLGLTQASYSAVSALDNARQDARFANINVRTFLTMGHMGQKDLSKMSQQELEQMAAETELNNEREKRKSLNSPINTAAFPGGVQKMGGQQQRGGVAQGIRGTPRRSSAIPSETIVPDSVKEVILTPSINSSVPPIPPNPPPSEAAQARKRKIHETTIQNPPSSEAAASGEATSSESSGEPLAKKSDAEVTGTPSPKEKSERSKTPKSSSKKRSRSPSTTPTSSQRAPRAAAIAANQAMTHQKPQTPSTSTATSSSSVQSGGQEQDSNFLDLLAKMAEEAAQNEDMDTTETSAAVAAPVAPVAEKEGTKKKTPKKTSPTASSSSSSTVSQRRNSTGKRNSRGGSKEPADTTSESSK
ncbi:hypothetical protein CRE_29326 [Caenorhabditis remanei]|uniref:KANL2-like probable zinc-finger domain-containing protein n=1 Tax=Caenorhabditis remanei TaxID=31234 RepID=E3MY56_CAERE|nr:hypothetical protein CRE_29326 [Caenorhabditis remanei]